REPFDDAAPRRNIVAVMVEVAPASADRDEGHSRLDEPPRQKRLFAHADAAVGVARGVALLRDVEGVFHSLGSDHVERPLLKTIELRDRRLPVERTAQAIELAAQLFAV